MIKCIFDKYTQHFCVPCFLTACTHLHSHNCDDFLFLCSPHLQSKWIDQRSQARRGLGVGMYTGNFSAWEVEAGTSWVWGLAWAAPWDSAMTFIKQTTTTTKYLEFFGSLYHEEPRLHFLSSHRSTWQERTDRGGSLVKPAQMMRGVETDIVKPYETVDLNLWVVTLPRVEWPFHRGGISDILTIRYLHMSPNSSKITATK